MQEWKTIPGFSSYEASNEGNVRNKQTGRLLKLKVAQKNYRCVGLVRDDKKRKDRTVHRLVMLAFVGPCPEGLIVRHLDGSKDNNRLENLKYGTQRENANDRARHGTMYGGSFSSLTLAQAEEVRAMCTPGPCHTCEHLGKPRVSNVKEAAERFGVSPSTIYSIVYGKSYNPERGA